MNAFITNPAWISALTWTVLVVSVASGVFWGTRPIPVKDEANAIGRREFFIPRLAVTMCFGAALVFVLTSALPAQIVTAFVAAMRVASGW